MFNCAFILNSDELLRGLNQMGTTSGVDIEKKIYDKTVNGANNRVIIAVRLIES